MDDTEVLIAGAGPTGLMLALWLVRRGVRVRVVDPKPGPTQETRALAVQARTLEFYAQLGLAARALARGRVVDHISLWVRGRLVGRAFLGDVGGGLTPFPYAFILTQDENEALLLAALRQAGGAVEWRSELTGFDQDEDGVAATLRREDGGTERLRARFLAGCDGAGSAVRHLAGIRFPGGTYAQTFYVADVAARGKLREGDLNLLLDDARFQAFFPLPGRGHHRIVGLLPPGLGAEPSFEQVRPSIEARGLTRVTALNWFSSYRVHHRVAEHFRVGRVFLLGDAGHVHTPVGGQGMNTGLGDAVNLAWKLAQALGGADEALLDSYAAERQPFAQALVRSTDRAFEIVVNPSGSARLVRTRLVPVLFPLLTRLRAVRRLLFLTVSQTRLHYPRSPLSQGRAGRVRGGDRLPWVPLVGGGSNFGALGLGWQLHVYGVPGPELLAWALRHDLPLRVFPFSRAARQAGLVEDAPCLVRPDGYLGLVAARFDPAAFDAYAARWLPKTSSPSVHAPPAAAPLG